MTVLLAVVSALTYGLSDFVGGLVSRRASAWAVAVLAQSSSTLCTAVVALGVPGSPGPGDLAWAVVAGVGTGAGTGFLYRGFSRGRIGVVAPVSAVGAALFPITAGALGGERLVPLVWVGIVLALPGIWLVAAEPGSAARSSFAAGAVDGVLAGIGFGVLFAALGQVPQGAGLWPLALTQAVSVLSVIALAILLRATWLPRGRPVRWALVAGPLGATATATFLLASQTGFLTVAGVLASLYPAVTVLLAALLLQERIHRTQAWGLLLCAGAVTLVTLG